MDSNDDRSFGDLGFHYDAKRDVLTGRVFIAKARSDDEDPKVVGYFRHMPEVLNDPTKGGLFGHAGGTFVLDEKKQKYFLTKEFSVSATTSSVLWSDMEYLIDLGARWSFKWFGHVAGIMHGWEQPPPGQ